MADSRINKRRCTNCGAYLDDFDKICYVCGEVQLPGASASGNSAGDVERPSYSFREDGDSVVPDADAAGGNPEPAQGYSDNTALPYRETPTERPFMPYGGKDAAKPYYEADRMPEQYGKKRGKKVGIICLAGVLAAALIAGAVCFCFYKGWLGGGDGNGENEEITLYFDRPYADIELISSDGKTYRWSGDVTVIYTVKDSESEKIVQGKKECKPVLEHNTLWEVTLPAEVESVYFYRTDNEALRTEIRSVADDKTVYYVTDTLFNSNNQLPLDEMPMDEFEDFESVGVNKSKNTDETGTAQSSPTESSGGTEDSTGTETRPSTGEDPTETGETEYSGESYDYFEVSLPDSWEGNIVQTKETDNEGSIVYKWHEAINYNEYGKMGEIVSVHIIDAGINPEDVIFSTIKMTIPSEDGTKLIVVSTPSSNECSEDQEAIESYNALRKDISKFIKSIKAK